jgi:hypothetical protein
MGTFLLFNMFISFSFLGILVVDIPSTAPIRVNSTPDFTEHHAPTSPTSTDGWGELENGIDEEPENDKDGWDDIEPLEETKPTPALANIQAAQRRPVSQPASHVKGINHRTVGILVVISLFPCLLITVNNFQHQIEIYLIIFQSKKKLYV